MDLVGVIFLMIFDFVAWLVIHFMCEFKYYWCKGECNSCHNWKCKIWLQNREDKK